MYELLQVNSNSIAISLFAGVMVIGLLLGFIVYFILSYRHKQKDYQLLQSQKEQIDSQNILLEKTLEELKATQSQLIYRERMASLGELTAGIAHEIQNPLNFVNNFSDVNSELVDELQNELKNKNEDAALSILSEIKENEKKINHHGKRADAIIKGMLQHSRSGTGDKELTDINALANEFIKLSYHGFRAKDKNFNATIKTDFDNNLQKINIAPQEIGRVLLNLYNNAFYAVVEKKKDTQPLKGSEEYEPTISVTTQKLNTSVEI